MHRKKHVHTDFCNCLSSEKEKFILENLSRIIEFTRNEGNFDDLVKSFYILGNNRKERILLAGLYLMHGKIFFLTNEVNFDDIIKKCEEEKSIRPLVSYLSSIAPNEIILSISSYDIYRFLQPPSEEWTNLTTLTINYVAQGRKANIYREIGYPYCCKKPNKEDAMDFWEEYSDYAAKQSSYSVFGLKDYMDWAEFFLLVEKSFSRGIWIVISTRISCYKSKKNMC